MTYRHSIFLQQSLLFLNQKQIHGCIYLDVYSTLLTQQNLYRERVVLYYKNNTLQNYIIQNFLETQDVISDHQNVALLINEENAL